MTSASDTLTRAEALAAGFSPLLMQTVQAAQNMARGTHGRRKSGMGEAFWQFRPWQTGDASRRIDWRQSAKRETLFVRETEKETAQTALMWRDASGSMLFSGERDRLRKKDYAETLLLALSLLMLDAGERVGILGSPLPPQTGVHSIQKINGTLNDAPLPFGTDANRAKIVLLSDFYFPLETTATLCATLSAAGCEGVIVQVADPAEQKLPGWGHVKFQDIEDADGAALEFNSVESLRADYASAFSSHRESLLHIAQRLGWGYEFILTDVPLAQSLARVYQRLSVKVRA